MSTNQTAGSSSTPTNPTELFGIPKAEFIADVGELLEKKSKNIEEMFDEHQELYQSYKRAESRLYGAQTRLNRKLPELKKALDSLSFLQEKKASTPIMTQYKLADNLYTKASIKDTSTVYLFLGANTLLEYPATEAQQVLEKNYSAAKHQHSQYEETLDFLKDQLTTTEVNIARLHNYRIRLRQEAQQKNQK